MATFRGSLQDIRLFVAAYEELSFTAAAIRENQTQSGISHHIRQLESQLKVRLFVREKNGVTRTPAADTLYRQCVQVLRTLDEAAHNMAQFSTGHQGRLSIGVTPAIARRILAPTMLRFAQCNPNVSVRVVEIAGSPLQMIATGEMDFAIGGVFRGERGLKARRLLVSPECLISRAVHEEATSSSEPLAESPINLVLPVLPPRRRDLIAASLAAQGISVGSEMQVDSALAILDLVSGSRWQSVAPCLILDPIKDELRFLVRPLRNPNVDFSLMLLEPTSRALTPEAQLFVDMIVEEALQVTKVWTTKFRAAGLLDE